MELFFKINLMLSNLYQRLTILCSKHGAVFFGQAIVSAGNFLTSVILARALGIEAFGYFSAIWLIVLISNTIIMGACVFPLMSNYHIQTEVDKTSFITGNIAAFFAILLAIVLLFTVVFALSPYSNEDANIFIFSALLLTLVCINIQDFMRRLFITIDKKMLALFSDLITYFSRIVGLCGLWYFSHLSIKYALFMCAITAGVGCTILWRKLPKLGDVSPSLKIIWLMNIKSAKWLVPAGLMQWTSINLFISMAVFFISPMAVGIIRVCQSLLSVLNIVIQAAENIIPLQASKVFKQQNSQALWRYLTKIALIGALPFILLAIFCFFFGGELLALFFGEIYKVNGGQALFVYSISYIFVFLIVPIRAGLRTIGKTDIWFRAYVISSLVSISLVYWLEVNFSSLGAVIGILVAHIILVGYTIIHLRHLHVKGGLFAS